jgi:hypothetical protein
VRPAAQIGYEDARQWICATASAKCSSLTVLGTQVSGAGLVRFNDRICDRRPPAVHELAFRYRTIDGFDNQEIIAEACIPPPGHGGASLRRDGFGGG